MPVTQVRAPDGNIVKVQHPDGATQDQIIAFAKQSHAAPSAPAEPAARTGMVGPAFAAQKSMQNVVGLGEKALSLATGTIAGPVSGLAGLVTGAIPGGRTAAEGVEDFGSALTFEPRTEAGQAPTMVGDAFRWIVDKVDRGVEVEGHPAVSTALKTTILGVPAIFGLKKVLTAKPKSTPAKTSESMDLGASGVLEAAERVVTSTFRRFKETVGEATPVPLTNTLAAARTALNELHKQGKGKSGLGKELQSLVSKNRNGVLPVAMLDDISSNMMKTISNPKATGTRQAKSVLEGLVDDMDAAGKSVGMNFADDLATSRAFAAMYRSKSDLGRVVGQHGERLNSFKKSDPAGYQEIIIDWSGKKLESFVSVNASGGRQFNTAKFAEWVSKNESHLNKLVGPQTIKVWKAFPKWEGRSSLLMGLGQRFLEMKTGGLSRMFNRQINLQFAEGIAAALTDPASPLFRALSTTQKAPSALPLPSQMFESAVAEEVR